MATSEATAVKMEAWHGRNGRTVESIDVWYGSKDRFAVLIRDHGLGARRRHFPLLTL
jgi:hypothetical protein